jgi:DNA-binding response OmpR family regulator
MDMKRRILIIDKDDNLCFLLSEFLKLKDFTVDVESDYDLSLRKVKTKIYDLCLVDVSAYDGDADEIIANINMANSSFPIVALSTDSSSEEAVKCLRNGCKDYLKKPFLIEELYLRIKNIFNTNTRQSKENIFKIGKFNFNADIQQLEIDSKIIKLTTKESELLKLLIENANNLLDRNIALKKIWNKTTDNNARSIDVYITKLRRIFQDHDDIKIINVHGRGFRMTLSNELEN